MTPGSAPDPAQIAGWVADPDPAVRVHAASYPDLPDDALRALCADPDPNVATVAVTTLHTGAVDWDEGRAAAVAGIAASDSGPDVFGWLDRATRDQVPSPPSEPLRRAQAQLLGSSAYMVRKWARTEWRWLATPDRLDPARRAVIARLTGDTTLLDRLTTDPDGYVRECAARNPKTPNPALTRLRDDPDEHVRDAAVTAWLARMAP